MKVLRIAALLLSNLLLVLLAARVSAQGIEDLEGFWCEAGIFESSGGTCVFMNPRVDHRVRFTVQGREIITIKYEFFAENYTQPGWGWTFRALRAESLSNFAGSLEEFRAGVGVCNRASAAVTVTASRKVIVLRYKGFTGNVPCSGTIGEREVFLRRME